MSFFSDRMLLVMFLTMVIHATESLNYSVSLVGIRTRRLATAGALFGMVLLISRTANMVQGVLMAVFVEETIEKTLPVQDFEWRIRCVLLAATAGSAIGAALLPTFVRYMAKGVELFVRHGSYHGLVGALIKRRGLTRDDFSRAVHGINPPKPAQIRVTPFSTIPWWFYLIDVLVTAVFTVGIVASLYAGVLVPDHRTVTSMMSGVVNGFATALMFLLISPRVSRYVDNALEDPSGLALVRAMAITLVLGKIGGTLAAQALLRPSASILAGLAKMLRTGT
jgi:Amj-like protein